MTETRSSVAPAGGNLQLAARVVGSVGGLGYLPRGPATAGALAGALVYALWRPGWQAQLACLAVACVLGQLAALVLAGPDEPDPKYLVLDEVAGVWVALFALPLGWVTCLAGAVLFRVLDRFKPPPVGTVDRHGGRLSVMGDDIVAGVIACAVLHVAVAVL